MQYIYIYNFLPPSITSIHPYAPTNLCFPIKTNTNKFSHTYALTYTHTNTYTLIHTYTYPR